MFLPIGDDCPRYRIPYVTFALIGVNVLVYLSTLTMSPERYALFVLDHASLTDSFNPWRTLTSGFIHFGLLHLLGNMWFLFLFGSSTEGKLGHVWMAATYFVCLGTSDLAQKLLGSEYRFAVGASGAVGGIVGVYWFLFCRAEVEFVYWFGWWWVGRVWLRVHWAVAWLFGWDILWWLLERTGHVRTGIAHGAHLGGLVSGLLCGFLIRRFSYVTLDGEDMFTRLKMWRLKANAPYVPAARREAVIERPPEIAPLSTTLPLAKPTDHKPAQTARSQDDDPLPL